MRVSSLLVLSVLSATLSCGFVQALETVPEVKPPKAWDHFVILMWQFQTDVKRDQAVYESLNLNGFHVDRRSDDLVAFGKEKGWPFYVDHAADKGILHLGDNEKHPNVAKVYRKREMIARPNSLADPATVAKLHGFLSERIAAAKGSTAVAYAFDDEISLGHFCAPAEVDTGEHALAFYRKQLKEEYQTIDKLNAQYGTSHKDFDSIAPVGFNEARGQVVNGGIGKMNLSAWCDWRAAMDTLFAEVLADLTRFSNGIDPTVPAGFVGGQGPSPWGGYDWRKLCKAVQWVEAYDIGASNTILRSFWSQQRPHMQTYFSSKDPRRDAWFLWYYLCQGNRGVIAWPEGWIKDGKAADHLVALAPTFKEVQGPVSKTIIDGKLQGDGVAIYYSHPSIQVSWTLDAACHGGTWPNRSSSMDSGASTSGLSRIGWVKSLQDAGVQPVFVNQDHLLAGSLGKSGIKILLLSRALCLSDAEVAAIRAFAKAGGTVIADHLCALFDEHGKARPAGALDDLFGVKRDLAQGWFNGKDLTEVNGELAVSLKAENWALDALKAHGVAVVERGLSTVGAAKGEVAGQSVALVRNGTATYLNLSAVGYVLHRGTEQGKEWLTVVSGLLKAGGVTPRLAISAKDGAAELIETLFWGNGPRTTVCVIKNTHRAATINSFGDMKGQLGDAAVQITLDFAKPVKDLRNERTGKAMGAGKTFTDSFVPWEANVYSYAE